MSRSLPLRPPEGARPRAYVVGAGLGGVRAGQGTRTLGDVSTATISGDQARHLRWAGGAMLGAGLMLTRLPAGVGLPCPLRTLTGVPCPFCGLQTSVKATVAGDLGAAVAANPAGVVLVVLAAVLLVSRPANIRLPPLPVVATVLSGMWVFELLRFGVVPFG